MLETWIDEVGGWAASQLEACTRCGICAGVCPFYGATGNPEVTPVWKLDLLRRAYEQHATLIGKLKVALRLERRVCEADLLRWSELNFSACSTCNRCSFTCPMGIAIGPLLHELRQRLADAGAVPENLQRVQQTLARDGNVFGYPQDERSGWVEYMDDAPGDLYQRSQADVVYFVGCVSSFAPRAQRMAESFVRVLTAAGINFTILGEGEVCCGYPLRAAGMMDKAQELVASNLSALQATGAHTLVFTCPACRLMWMEEYARYIPDVRLLHAAEFLAELIRLGQLELGPFETTVTYHDPCDLGRTGGVYEAPRRVLQSIPGLRLREVSERRESGICCGGGGDVEMVAPQSVKQVAVLTAGKLAAPGADLLATACPQCLRVLEEGLKSAKPEMKVLDISEIIARSLELG